MSMARPRLAKKPLACAEKIGRFGTPGKTMTASLVSSSRVVSGVTASAKAVVIAVTIMRFIIASSLAHTLSCSQTQPDADAAAHSLARELKQNTPIGGLFAQ